MSDPVHMALVQKSPDFGRILALAVFDNPFDEALD